MAIRLNINRRHLLNSAATVAVAGIAPNIPHAEIFTKSEIVSSKTWATPYPESPARNFGTITVLRLREIAERNSIRQAAGLPLLSVLKELRRMKELADSEKFRKFADAH